jgi:hypothetical protein
MSGKQRDWAVATGLFIAAIALAVPFRSRIPFHWDSAEFAIAVTHYDVRLSQPHAPGYFLYVMLGKLLNCIVGNPHASLVWISVVAGGGLAAVMYFLGVALFGRRTGLTAGLLAMTSPLVWFHSCVALTYVLDGFLVCVVVLVCWRAMQRGGTWCDAVLIGGLLAVLGGFRQQSVPTLVPAVLYSFWRFQRPRLAKLVLAVSVAVAFGLAWFVPMVTMSGGLPVYLKIIRLHTAFNAPATFAGGGFNALAWNVFFVGLFGANGLMLAGLVLLGALLYRARRMDAERKRQWDHDHAQALQMLAMWIGPMLLSATVIGFTKQPGYVLNFLPGLLLLAAVALAQVQWTVTAVVCAFNVITFVAWPPSWDGAFFGVGRTARLLREQQRETLATLAAIRQYSPNQVFVCHATDLYFGLRQFQILLPEFDQYQLPLDPTMITPPGRPMLAIRCGQLEFVARGAWSGKRFALLLVPPGMSLSMFQPYLDVSHAEAVPESAGMLFVLRSESTRQ